jgi:cytochrome c553
MIVPFTADGLRLAEQGVDGHVKTGDNFKRIGHGVCLIRPRKETTRMKRKIVIALWVACLIVTRFATADPVEDGKKIVEAKKCSICHAIDGKGGKSGKPMNGITEGKTDDWLIESLKDPKKAIGPDTKMLSYKDKLTDDEMKAVVAYIKTLKK